MDIALQTLGTVEAVVKLCERNGVGLTEKLTTGQVLEYDLGDIEDKRVVETYAREGVVPAMAVTDKEILKLKGIEVVTISAEEKIEAEAVARVPRFSNVFDVEFGTQYS